MELENKIKCVLMDFEINEITLQEATKRILLLLGVSNRALLLKIKKLEADNKLLKFMVENGLGEEDMMNDITYPHEL